MTYYAKLGRAFFNQLFWLTYAASWIIIKLHKFGYWDLVFVLLALMTLPVVIMLGYFKLFKRPIFKANEAYIFDCYNNIKYYWDEIEEVIPTADDFLQIKLYEPEKHLNKIKNPFQRFFREIGYRIFKKKPTYRINLAIIDIKKGENKNFLDMLDDYSVEALANEK
jgi:hypothetical protein